MIATAKGDRSWTSFQYPFPSPNIKPENIFWLFCICPERFGWGGFANWPLERQPANDPFSGSFSPTFLSYISILFLSRDRITRLIIGRKMEKPFLLLGIKPAEQIELFIFHTRLCKFERYA